MSSLPKLAIASKPFDLRKLSELCKKHNLKPEKDCFVIGLLLNKAFPKRFSYFVYEGERMPVHLYMQDKASGKLFDGNGFRTQGQLDKRWSKYGEEAKQINPSTHKLFKAPKVEWFFPDARRFYEEVKET